MIKLLRAHWFPLLILMAALAAVLHEMGDAPHSPRVITSPATPDAAVWQAPDTNSLGNDSAVQLIRYGRNLVANTSQYLGPKGTVAAITNGMNCQNCHIDAGARPWGNCFSAVAATYPVYRPRSGRIESIEFRVNDCLQRSLNGQPIDSSSKEMRAMVAYIKWLGATTAKGTRPSGAGLQELDFIERAADKEKGKIVFEQQCSRCHGTNGEGQLSFDNKAYAYPPLWGKHSYNIGAGMYRLSKLAAYVKDNMPFDKASHSSPVLSVEQAWDVAAFINSQPRPQKDLAQDWPDMRQKAFDYPFGPYTDGFTETQHKYGPFAPIKQAKKEAGTKKKNGAI
jgi:thiosulfate dehydrogenase